MASEVSRPGATLALPPHPTVLVDATVWLELLTDRTGGARRASVLLDALEARGASLVVPLTCLQDLYRAVLWVLGEGFGTGDDAGSAARRQVAWASVRMVRERCVAVGADMGDCLEAEYLRASVDDLPGALVLAAARRCKADLLLTEDTRLLAHSTLAARDVAGLCEALGLGEGR